MYCLSSSLACEAAAAPLAVNGLLAHWYLQNGYHAGMLVGARPDIQSGDMYDDVRCTC